MAYKIMLSVKGIDVGYDLVLFRVGSVATQIVYLDIGSPDLSSFQRYVTSPR